MNVFIHELKANAKPLIIWCCAEFFIIFGGMLKYQGFSDSGVDMTAMLSNFPKSLMTMFGLGSVDLSTVDGFYSVFFLYFMLLAAIHAIMFGAVVVSKEERDHSADFLFSKPVKRYQIMAPKFFAGVINILVFNLVTFGASVFFIAQYNNGNGLIDKVALTMLALFIFQLFFLSLGVFLGALLKTTKKATSIATGIVLLTFFLSIMIDLSEKLEFLTYLTPFKYFKGKDLIIDGSLSLSSVLILTSLSIIFMGLSYFIFNKRDLNT
jgi:ABC-2 type transport system permease protein